MLGIALMIVAAALNATASVLQRRANQDVPESRAFSLRMLLDLVRRPVWVFGVLSMISGFVLHAVSISISRIALVQPLLVAELPFTILLASRVSARLPATGAWASGRAAAFVGAGTPRPRCVRTPGRSESPDLRGRDALVARGLSRAEGTPGRFLGSRRGRPRPDSSLIAGAGAVSPGGLFTTWQTYGVAVLGPISFFLLQNALEGGNLVASQPGFTLTNPLVSVVWGLAVFGEQARGGVFFVGTVAGGVLIAAGSILLARSPLLDPDATGAEGNDDGEGGSDDGRGARRPGNSAGRGA